MDFSVSNKSRPNIDTNGVKSPTVMTLLNDNGEIYAYICGHWYRTNEEPENPVAVAVGPGGFWCLDKAGNIHQWNEKPVESVWARDEIMEHVTALSYDADGNLWCVNTHGHLYFSNMESPQHAPIWTAAAFENAWFLGNTWEYTTNAGDHLLTVIRNHYHMTDDDRVYQIADEIVRLNNLTNKLDSIEQAGQILKMPPLGYR